ncbi:MAG: ArsR family transcriptional regulator [Desulfobacterales bacterium]|nr:ArsR family transcriptional regulator [Desulfobacterales bacterium]
MSDRGDVVRKHLRITILRILLESPGYTANNSMITDLTQNYGQRPSRDNVRIELSWLKAQGLVNTDGESKLIIASLTERGADVARGREVIPGVKRPSAGS